MKYSKQKYLFSKTDQFRTELKGAFLGAFFERNHVVMHLNDGDIIIWPFKWSTLFNAS